MKTFTCLVAALVLGFAATTLFSQETVCINGVCYKVESLEPTPAPLPQMIGDVATAPIRMVGRVVENRPVRRVVAASTRPVRRWVQSRPIARLFGVRSTRSCGG